MEGLPLWCVFVCFGAVTSSCDGNELGVDQRTDMKRNDDDASCQVRVDDRSINYFRSRLQIAEPNFIRFDVKFSRPVSEWPNATHEVFDPFHWVWTYKSNRGLYPYVHWNVDYHILSFELLDVKTLWTDPYILFNLHGNCQLTMGTAETTHLLVKQLTLLVSKLSEDNQTITKYQESYWCYLAEAPGFRDTTAYVMGLYLIYPTRTINYNCCSSYYNYEQSAYNYSCMPTQMSKWLQCTVGPYILGIILFLYSPLILLKAAGWDSKRESASRFDYDGFPNESSPVLISKPGSSNETTQSTENDKWVYLDGSFPKSFAKLFSSLFPDQHPVAISRFKRFVFVIFGPSIVFIQVGVYKAMMPGMMVNFVERGVPVGFLTLLGNSTEAGRKAFVPLFGGPISVLCIYYVLGILFLVFPRSIQDIMENGIPRLRSSATPLGLSALDIKTLSKINVQDKSGYRSAANLALCSFYMLFTTSYWLHVFSIQKQRLTALYFYSQGILKCMFVVVLPVYVMLCFIEVVICTIYFAIPMFSFIVVIVRGAVKTVAITVRSSYYGGSVFSKLIKNRPLMAIFSFTVAAFFVFYVYSTCLVFIESFYFLSQILVFCYVAVIVYPSAAFGYLFFGVILLYYIFRLIRGFGVKYLDLLNDVVEIAMQMEDRENYVSVFDGNLVISNVKISKIKGIKINDLRVPLAQNFMQSYHDTKQEKTCRLKFTNNTYGIRKDLFDYVVKKHLPVHQQVLKVLFHLSVICLLLLITISLTAGFVTGPTSEISDVMHVIFIITVGALPRVLEVAMLDSSEHIHRDIKLRQLEDTVNMYWSDISGVNGTRRSSVECNDELEHMSSNS